MATGSGEGRIADFITYLKEHGPGVMGRMMIAVVPIPVTFFCRLFFLPKEKAIDELHSIQSLNVSIDVLLTAFGILVGTLLSSKVGLSNMFGWSFAMLLLAVIAILVMCGLLPSLDVYSRDSFWYGFIAPNTIALIVLAVCIGVTK